MISPLRMAWLHLTRKKLPSLIMIFSLSIALAGSGLLLRFYRVSEDRFNHMATNVQAIVGPKCGGIEILLGALNLESKCREVIPFNLFETLKAGTAVRFEDGEVVSSRSFTKNLIPFLQVGKYQSFQVMATDDSFLSILNSDKINGSSLFRNPDLVWVGVKVARLNELKENETIQIQLRHSGVVEKLTVGSVLPEQFSDWDYGVFISLEKGRELLKQSGFDHPTWHGNILSFYLIQMDQIGFAPLKALINDRSVAQIIWVNNEKQSLADISGLAGNLGFLITLVILCLAGLSIFGMMSIRSEGLRVSMATLEAIGFPRSYVFSWMVLESLGIGLVSSILAISIESSSFFLLKGILNTTWIIPSYLEGSSWSAGIILLQGMVFSAFGATSSILQLIRVNVHQELKSG